MEPDPVDPELAKANALRLQEVIATDGPYDPWIELYLTALQPFIDAAIEGRLDDIDPENRPNPYKYRDQGTDDLPVLDAALAEFTSSIEPSDPEVLAYIESLLEKKNKDATEQTGT